MQAPIFDARRGWSTLGLAFLAPLAVTGLVIMGLYIGNIWGSEPASEPSSTLSVAVMIALFVGIRYIAMAAWWGWLSLATGRPWTRGLAPALPIIGIYWSLILVAPVVRGETPFRRVSRTWARLTAVIVVLAFVTLPVAMTLATTLDQREVIRLAGPCTFETDLSLGAPVASVGSYVLGNESLNELVSLKAAQTSGAGAAHSPLLPLAVATETVQQFLLIDGRIPTPSVGQIENEVDAGLQGQLVDSSIRESVIRDACLYETQAAFLSDGTDGTDGKFAGLAKGRKITIAPTLGFWDPSAAQVVRTEPTKKPQLDSAVEASKPETAFRTQVDYADAPLKDGVFTGLEWTADVCVSSSSLLESQYRNAVRLYKRTSAQWVQVPGTKVVSKQGGRCGKTGTNITVTSKADDPGFPWVDMGWTTCRGYKLTIPETPKYAATDVPMCVSVEASSTGDAS